MIFDGLIRGIPVQVLIDSGASRNFISTSVVKEHQLELSYHPSSISVQTADGRARSVKAYLKEEVLRIGSYKEVLDFETYPLESYDVILGKEWLDSRENVKIDFKRNKISFEEKGLSIELSRVKKKKKKKKESQKTALKDEKSPGITSRLVN